MSIGKVILTSAATTVGVLLVKAGVSFAGRKIKKAITDKAESNSDSGPEGGEASK